jgi:AraC-like DNA-binding protein
MIERRLAIGEIAFLLGFSEVSAFHRAFRHWTGHAPHAYRALQYAPAQGRRTGQTTGHM